MKTIAFRIEPDLDLKNEIMNVCKREKINAGVILTCVGSLKKISIRLAGELKILTANEKFEIVSLVGTLSSKDAHLHMSIADQTGKVLGGHLKEGCIIHTTAEVVIGIAKNQKFNRKFDKKTGFDELEIKRK